MTDYRLRTPGQLGAVLKGFRRERRLTQAAVGAAVGLPQNAISQLEAAPERSSLARVFKVLSALELEVVVRPRPPGKRADW